MRLLRLAAAFLVAASPAAATDFTKDGIGTTGSDFLLFDIGSRGIALGGAHVATTNDAYSLYWNPAGLTRVPRSSLGLMYSRYIAGMDYQSATYAHRITDTSVLAAGWRYLDGGEIVRTDVNNIERGTFHARQYVAEMGWGKSIFDMSDGDMDVSFGVAMRWIHSDLLAHADGFSGDIGMQTRILSGPVPYDVGFVAQNMGVGQNFDQRRDFMPFRARLGGAVYPMKDLTLSLEGIFPQANVPHGALGVEYGLPIQSNVKVALRGGFNSMTVESLGAASTLNLGFGVTVSDFTFDYAFAPMGVLGTDVHRFTLSWNLPAKVTKRLRKR